MSKTSQSPDAHGCGQIPPPPETQPSLHSERAPRPQCKHLVPVVPVQTVWQCLALLLFMMGAAVCGFKFLSVLGLQTLGIFWVNWAFFETFRAIDGMICTNES